MKEKRPRVIEHGGHCRGNVWHRLIWAQEMYRQIRAQVMVHLDRTIEKNRIFRTQDSLLRVKDKFSSNDKRSSIDSSSEFDTSKSMSDTDSVQMLNRPVYLTRVTKSLDITKNANQRNLKNFDKF